VAWGAVEVFGRARAAAAAEEWGAVAACDADRQHRALEMV